MARLWKNLVGAAMLVTATTLVTTQVVSQDAPPDFANMPPAAQRAMERMQAWMQYGSPGPEHTEMQKNAGTWHNGMRSWRYEGADEMQSEGISRLRTILGGRFLLEETMGVMEFMGERQVSEGLGIYGYDNYHQKHFFIWLDNWSTMPMIGHGERAANGDIVYYSELPDPSNGKTIEYKSVLSEISTDSNRFVMYEKQPDGSWFKHMEMTATRH
jgi:hypothetical protein